MTPQTQQLLDECEQQQKDNKTQLDETAQRWETAARAGCASVDELETQLDKLKTISKRLALRKAALTEQLAVDVEQARLADVERVTDECNAIAAGIAQQYKAISAQSDKLAGMFDKVLADGQAIHNKVHELMLLEADEVPAEIRALDLGTFTTKEKSGAFHHKQNAVYALSERIVNNATQRIKTKR